MKELEYPNHLRLCFADDAAILVPTKKCIVQAIVQLERLVKACGLTIYQYPLRPGFGK